MISWFMINFQNSNSLNMIMMNKLNNFIIMMMLMILFFIIYMTMFMYLNKFINKLFIDNKFMEIIWIIIPFLLILIMSFNSIKILYLNNELKNNFLNIKIMGNQWFWYYEYLNLNIKFNSYLLKKNNFDFFMLETDNSLILPFNYNIQIIISSMDVIHSWTIPSLNMKIDSIPNQINMINMNLIKSGIMFGQCSEICGINHSFMPIKIESINYKNFLNWLMK